MKVYGVKGWLKDILGMTVSKFMKDTTQPAFTCSNLTKETLEQGVKYVQN